MAELHVVSALVAKRSEVSGLIADLERKIAQQRADLVHVDAVLGLSAPGLESDCIPFRTVRPSPARPFEATRGTFWYIDI